MAVNVNALTESFPGFKVNWGIDEYLFSAQGNDLNHGRKADTIDGSGFGTLVKNNLPGMQEGNLKIKGLASMAKGRLNYVLNQRFGRTTPVLAWYALQGLTALSPVTMQPSSITDSSVMAKLKDAVEFDLELNARGDYNDGFILVSPKALLTITGMGPEDNNTGFGGATLFGGTAQMHVWAVDGGTTPSMTMKIQHSPDGTTWTDLVTFAAVTAPGAQRVVLPSTTTVNARVRASYTITGTPTGIQALVGFARGVDLDS